MFKFGKMSATLSPPIQIKANRDGFTLVPDHEAPFPSILAYLEDRLRESKDFFQNAEMTLDLRERTLGSDEIREIHRLLTDRGGLRLMEVRIGEDVSFFVNRPANPPIQPPPVQAFFPQPDENSALLVRTTCRSGTRIVSESDCVVLGDVNPGAEIIALGDIVIFGNLRGIAHAGAAGDRSARIWALSIEPSQIRIADMVAVPPRGKKPKAKRFEIAEIRDNQIEVITL